MYSLPHRTGSRGRSQPLQPKQTIRKVKSFSKIFCILQGVADVFTCFAIWFLGAASPGGGVANRKSVWCTSLDTCFNMKLQISYSSSQIAEENACAYWSWLILRGDQLGLSSHQVIYNRGTMNIGFTFIEYRDHMATNFAAPLVRNVLAREALLLT